MKKAIILDDEQSAINILSNYLQYFDDIEVVATCKTLDAAEQAILDLQPDLLFLDIEIQSQFVFTMLDRLKQLQNSFSIIFITAHYKKYLEEVIRSCSFKYPFSYIGKPIEFVKLEEELEKFRAQVTTSPIPTPELDYFILKTGQRFLKIPFSNILYCESDGNYCNIFFIKNGEIQRQNLQRSLIQLERDFPDRQFYRMSHKHLINTDFFDEVRTNGRHKSCILDFNGDRFSLPIPEKRWRLFQKKLLEQP